MKENNTRRWKKITRKKTEIMKKHDRKRKKVR